MRKRLKLCRLSLVFLMIILGFTSPILADETSDGGGDDNNTYVAGELEMLDIDDIVGEDSTSQSSHTDLTTVVPATVNIVIIGQGVVSSGGKIYENNSTFTTTSTSLIFNISPFKGYKIGQVYWNFVDVTAKVKNGVLKLSEIES